MQNSLKIAVAIVLALCGSVWGEPAACVDAKVLRATLSSQGDIERLQLAGKGDRAVSAYTAVAGCRVDGAVLREDKDGATVYTKHLVEEKGGHRCVLRERFVPDAATIRWEVEITGEGEPWSAPIETHFNWPESSKASYWTAWSDPEQSDKGWHDPLVFRPLEDRLFYYGAPPFDEKEPNSGYCPLHGNTFCMPLITMAEEEKDLGISLVLSPADLLLDLEMRCGKDGAITFSRLNHRIAPNNPIRFAMNLVTHPADWRGGLGWMADRYAAFFEPPNPAAFAMTGCGAYSSYEGPLDAARYYRMAFRVNWKASFDFPYMGMFLPPVPGDTDRWRRFDSTSSGFQMQGKYTETSRKQMADYAARMQSMGFSVLSYFNVTEFGTRIKSAEPVNQHVSEADCWKNAKDFLFTRVADGVLYNTSGDTWGTWGGAVVMDPAGEQYQAFLLDQARRHIEKIPASPGICIDRLDWLRFYNPREDDGVSWLQGKPCRSLFVSWKDLIDQLGPIMHDAGKVIFVNNHLKRIDLLPQVDGIYCEFAQDGRALNSTGLLSVHKPAMGWTASVDDLKPGPDALFQRHLHMGVFPTAPLFGNDHTIVPNEWADQYYLDYGPMLDALRGRKWVLQPNIIMAEGVKVNLFEVPGGFVAPVTFGGENSVAHITLRGLKIPPAVKQLAVTVMHPGAAKWTSLGMADVSAEMHLDVPLKRGCAMLSLAYAWVQPKQYCFQSELEGSVGTTIAGATMRYTLDGSTPQADSPVCDPAFKLTDTAVVTLGVFTNGERVGDYVRATYGKAPIAAPRITGWNNRKKSKFKAVLSPPEGAQGLCYTLDGSEPNAASPRYTQPIQIAQSVVLSARALGPKGELGLTSKRIFAPKPRHLPKLGLPLDTLTPRKATAGWGDTPKMNRSIQGGPLSVNGEKYAQGVGVHAPSELVYACPPRCRAFTAFVGVDDEMRDYPEASVQFQVFADDTLLQETPVLRANDEWYFNCAIPPGAKEIRLVATDGGDGMNADHADWCRAGFLINK